jgi:electron transfer flavoprotein alpha subunit
MSVWVWVDHEGGVASELGLQAVTLAGSLAEQMGEDLAAVTFGDVELGGAVDSVWKVEHPLLSDYAPGAYGACLVQLMSREDPSVLVAPGSDRGNEVLAHVAALADLPMAANVMEVDPGSGPWSLVRVRWGGSLLERAELVASVRLLSAAAHAFEPAVVDGDPAPVSSFEPQLDEGDVVARVVDRVTEEEGITLATAPVVVSGGRGVGSADGFTPLEELAGLLGGAVGCSRVVTNNGWRPHSDQVGQTGTRVAPDVYIACGISGAIQHWVGMMAAKNVIAINTDPEAPMVTKADYALIADLAQAVPAIVAEIHRRQT